MTADKLQNIAPDYRYKTPPFNGIIENEVCPIYIAHALGSPKPNASEVGDYKWISWADYTKALAEDAADVFSWWSKDQLQHIRSQADAFLGRPNAS
jgi:isopentenyl-diphosphate delta-isomerase